MACRQNILKKVRGKNTVAHHSSLPDTKKKVSQHWHHGDNCNWQVDFQAIYYGHSYAAKEREDKTPFDTCSRHWKDCYKFDFKQPYEEKICNINTIVTLDIDGLIFRPDIPMQASNEKTRHHLIHAAETKNIVSMFDLKQTYEENIYHQYYGYHCVVIDGWVFRKF